MSDDETGDPSGAPATPSVAPEEAVPEPQVAVHHGEALVAALLNTRNALGDAASEPPGGRRDPTPPPLTASTVLSHTDSATAVDSDGSRQDRDTTPRTQQPDTTDGGDGGEEDPDLQQEEEPPSFARNLLEWVVVLAAAVAVAIILRTFVFQAFFIPSESMEATLFENDRILVNKVSYRLHDVNRGDVVVFRRPDDQPGEIRDLIKRVIGLPGDTVEGRGGSIYINDQLLIEPYLDPEDRFGDFGPVEVPEGELFMMGDNRDQSLDSRRFGTISEDRVVGRAFFLWYPFDRLGSL